MDKTLLSLGHGYSARALAARLIPQGWRIIGTRRSADAGGACPGVELLQWPGTDLAGALDRASHLLISAAPDAGGDPVLAALSGAIARAHQVAVPRFRVHQVLAALLRPTVLSEPRAARRLARRRRRRSRVPLSQN